MPEPADALTSRITFVTTAEVEASLRAHAQEAQSSVSREIRYALLEYLERHASDPPQPEQRDYALGLRPR